MNDKNFSIASGTKNYEVTFVPHIEDLISQLSSLSDSITIIDRQLETLYPELIKQLTSFTKLYPIAATEENKTLTGAEDVLCFLQTNRATKSTTVVAIGGGIVQDIVSFAAHIYFRGLRFVFVPTTLLAMCDSCIGGKCGLNYHGFKNQLGAFHPPEKVIIWKGFIDSLPIDAIYSGYGEIFKLMLIGGQDLYANLEKVLNTDGMQNKEVLNHIHQGLVIKKKFIEEDEFDVGVRRILNYGHTFGHALELATNYAIPHGIAVARGIDIANYISLKQGFLSQTLYEAVHDFIKNNFHCDMLPKVSAEALIENAQKDKKASKGSLSMIFMEDIGKFRIEPILLDEKINGIVRDYIKHNPALYAM